MITVTVFTLVLMAPFDALPLAHPSTSLGVTLSPSKGQDQQAPAPSAKAVQVSAPAQVGTLDGGKLKGEPIQLAWSPDGTKLFLQTAARDKAGMAINPRFYVMSVADGKPDPVDAPPVWVADYWAWKAGQFAPGSTTYGIEFKEDYRTVTSTSSPMGGALAKGGVDTTGGGGTTAEDVANHAQQMQKQHVVTYTLKGEVVGEFVGQQVVHGYTFGWSPAAMAMMAYGNQSGHLTLIDRHGQKQQVDATKNVILPAWSGDGSKIAFLQRAGKSKYDVFIVTLRQQSRLEVGGWGFGVELDASAVACNASHGG